VNTKFIQSIYWNPNLICIFNGATLALTSCPKLGCIKEMGGESVPYASTFPQVKS
jgi:hypothetical protein